MITSKNELKEYLNTDKIQLGIKRKRPRLFSDEIWKYEIYLRKYEYWIYRSEKSHVILYKIIKILFKYLWHKQGVKLGISIAPNVCGKGLSIAHYGCIEINDTATVGDNLRIHEGVTIGASGGGAPVLGNNIFLSSGCKVIGDIKIADRCVIGANAVVVRSITEEGVTFGGVPAKKISNNNSDKYIYWYCRRKK